MVDLKVLIQFCGARPYEENPNPALAVPWSEGEFSFFSNGVIIVRVQRIDTIPERPDAPKVVGTRSEIEKALDSATGELMEIPPLDLAFKPCSCCGYGKGFPDFKKVAIGPALFSDHELALLAKLPGVRISPRAKKLPNRFVFDGGDGLIMPIRCADDE